MSDLRDSLQRATDDAAAPIRLDELTRHAAPAAVGLRPRRPLLLLAAAVVAVVLVAAPVWRATTRDDRVTAGPGDVPRSTGADRSPDRSRQQLEEFMLLRGASVSGMSSFTTLGQLASGDLTFEFDDFALIVGRVASVTPLAGYYAGAGEDEGSTYEVGFDDPRAGWRTVVLDVQIDETLVGDVEGSVRVGFVIPPTVEVDLVRDAFRSYGTVVLPLSTSPVFEDEPGVWAIVWNGETLMTVDGDRRLALPFKPADAARALLSDASTLDDLRLHASRHPSN